MSSTENIDQILPPEMTPEGLNEWFDKRFTQSMADYKASKPAKLSIMVTKGTLDWAYPSFILGSTAAAMGWDTTLFFTFYGLTLLKKDFEPQITPLGNPAMPMKMPFGPKWFQDYEWPMPNLLMAGVPGFEKVATGLMKKTFKNKGVASIPELRDMCLELDVELIACQMTMDLFEFGLEDMIEGPVLGGAATYIEVATQSDINLFI